MHIISGKRSAITRLYLSIACLTKREIKTKTRSNKAKVFSAHQGNASRLISQLRQIFKADLLRWEVLIRRRLTSIMIT